MRPRDRARDRGCEPSTETETETEARGHAVRVELQAGVDSETLVAPRAARIAPRAMFIALPLVATSLVVVTALRNAEHRADLAGLRAGQEQAVAIQIREVALDLRQTASDALYLAEQSAVQRWAARADGTESAARNQVEQDFLAFAGNKRDYDQIRLLDVDGQEIVRVERRGGNATSVSQTDLQNKSDRYYVRAALELARGELYLSPFDLNVEHGEIEYPLKPTLRVATPIFEGNSRLRGLVVLNYLGKRLLDGLREVSASRPGRYWLVNDRGYWLVGPRPDDEWGFMYRDRKDRSIVESFPEAWSRIQTGSTEGRFEISGEQFAFARLEPRSILSAGIDGKAVGVEASESWVAIAYLPESTLDRAVVEGTRRWSLLFIGLMLLIGAVAWVTAGQHLRRLQAEGNARASAQHFHGLLLAAPDAVVICDGNGRIVFFSNEAERTFGYRATEVIGQPVELLVPERFRSNHFAQRTRYMDHPRTRALSQSSSLQGRRKDGSEFPAAITLGPVRSDRGAFVFSSIRDVSETQRAEREIRELNLELKSLNGELSAQAADLQEANKELEAFTYTASHDLRTPLRGIDGFSRLLLEKYATVLDDTGKDYLGRIQRATNRLDCLIDDLLKLSRLTKTRMHTTRVDLAEIARAIAAELEASAPQREVHWKIAENLVAAADPALIRVALENLLGNAWKYTGKRRSASIEVGIADTGNGPAFFVRDDGAGFDMTFAEKLFRPFERLHSQEEFAGTGIGLAIVQRIVRRHQGLIWVESRVDEGAIVYFTLPPLAEIDPGGQFGVVAEMREETV